jgi:deoxyhypusine synthase
VSPSLNRITPTAPAVTAFCSFCVNAQVPRWISATAPLVAAGKSEISQPLVVPPGLGIVTSLVGTTATLDSDFVGECSNAMKSTDGELSSAALPAT